MWLITLDDLIGAEDLAAATPPQCLPCCWRRAYHSVVVPLVALLKARQAVLCLCPPPSLAASTPFCSVDDGRPAGGGSLSALKPPTTTTSVGGVLPIRVVVLPRRGSPTAASSLAVIEAALLGAPPDAADEDARANAPHQRPYQDGGDLDGGDRLARRLLSAILSFEADGRGVARNDRMAEDTSITAAAAALRSASTQSRTARNAARRYLIHHASMSVDIVGATTTQLDDDSSVADVTQEELGPSFDSSLGMTTSASCHFGAGRVHAIRAACRRLLQSSWFSTDAPVARLTAATLRWHSAVFRAAPSTLAALRELPVPEGRQAVTAVAEPSVRGGGDRLVARLRLMPTVPPPSQPPPASLLSACYLLTEAPQEVTAGTLPSVRGGQGIVVAPPATTDGLTPNPLLRVNGGDLRSVIDHHCRLRFALDDAVAFVRQALQRRLGRWLVDAKANCLAALRATATAAAACDISRRHGGGPSDPLRDATQRYGDVTPLIVDVTRLAQGQFFSGLVERSRSELSRQPSGSRTTALPLGSRRVPPADGDVSDAGTSMSMEEEFDAKLRPVVASFQRDASRALLCELVRHQAASLSQRADDCAHALHGLHMRQLSMRSTGRHAASREPQQ